MHMVETAGWARQQVYFLNCSFAALYDGCCSGADENPGANQSVFSTGSNRTLFLRAAWDLQLLEVYALRLHTSDRRLETALSENSK